MSERTQALPVPHSDVRRPWLHDIETEWAALSTTGGKVWDAAVRLAGYLEATLDYEVHGQRTTSAEHLPSDTALVQNLGGDIGINYLNDGDDDDTASNSALVHPQWQAPHSLEQQECSSRNAVPSHMNSTSEHGQSAKQHPQTGTGNGLRRPRIKILELGAGTGWLGMILAHNLTEADLILLTEQADEGGGAMSHLRNNVTLNAAAGRVDFTRLAVTACDWNDWRDADSAADNVCKLKDTYQHTMHTHTPTTATDGAVAEVELAATSLDIAAASVHILRTHDDGITTSSMSAVFLPDAAALPDTVHAGMCQDSNINVRSVQWDYIIGTDLVYNEAGCRLLPKVMRGLCSAQTVLYYCHTRHRFDNFDLVFFDNLRQTGLLVEEVVEPGQTIPDSPPLFSELFPDMRIAVYRCVLPTTE